MAAIFLKKHSFGCRNTIAPKHRSKQDKLVSCILDIAICIKNKRNLLKIKGKKVFNSKQVEGASSGGITTKIFEWRFTLATF